MKKATFLRKMFWLMLIPFLAFACDDKMDEHYEVPDWVPASAWEVLQSGENGNYSIFLEGVELAGYRPMLEGQSLLTVMAPDDTAFKTYLESKGYASIKDMPADELKKLIGFHLMYYSYNTDNLINFRPKGSTETDEEKKINAGLYYKHRTYSANEPTTETDPVTGENILVYHQERFLPVFSHLYFNSKKINAKENYEYFFPQSTWNGDAGFNVANASVKEYGIKANNGYIHVVDQVLEPLETIYTELRNKEEYSTFIKLFDTYGGYEEDATLTNLYKESYGVDAIYLYKHTNLNNTNIACEWISTSYTDFEKNSKEAYTVFAPTNEAFSSFFNDFWKKGGYASLEEVDKTAINEVLQQYIYSKDLVFPEEIKSGLLVSASGSAIDNIDFSSVKEPMMCVNGAVYGMDEMKLPAFLQSVLSPVYRNMDMRTFMYAIDGSGLKNNYTLAGTNYILLVPTKEQFEANNIYTVYVTRTLEQESEDGRVTMSASALSEIANMHTANIVTGESNQLPTEGVRVIPTQCSWNFWFIKDGKITTNALYNLQLNPQNTNTDIFSTFTKVSDEKNGTVYQFGYNGLFEEASQDITRDIAICANKEYEYHHFSQLLKKAGLATNEMLLPAYQLDENDNIIGPARYIAFIPTNEAIEKSLAENRIPGCVDASFGSDGELLGSFDEKQLKEYLKSYFLTLSTNNLSTYPYIGSSMKSGKYITQQTSTESGTAPALIYTDNGSSLSVQLEGGNVCHVIPKYNYFPFAYEDGCFHLIDDTL